MTPSKAKGTSFETSLITAFEPYWPGTLRSPRWGRADKGDLYMPGNDLYIVEAKNEKKQKIPEWWRETTVEAVNAGVPFGLLVHKRRGTTAPEDQWATMTLGQWLRLVHR